MIARIAILETGRPPEALAAVHGRYPDMFRTLLGETFGFETFDVTAGVLPDPTAFDGAIIPGSPAGVYEDHVWIPPLLDWIRAAQGQLQFDLWGVKPSARWDWAGLKEKIKAHGLRNSLLLAPM